MLEPSQKYGVCTGIGNLQFRSVGVRFGSRHCYIIHRLITTYDAPGTVVLISCVLLTSHLCQVVNEQQTVALWCLPPPASGYKLATLVLTNLRMISHDLHEQELLGLPDLNNVPTLRTTPLPPFL